MPERVATIEERPVLRSGIGLTAADVTIPAVEIAGLRYWYPESETAVLDGVDLRIDQGEMAIVIGASGGGKSTLMLTLNGIVPKQLGGRIAGSVRVGGLDPLEHELSEMATRVGLVFQDPDAQLAAIFVRDEVAFGPQNLRLERAVVERQLAEALDFVGLSRLAGRDVYSLSGGEKQRLAIASVLAMEPGVIVLDEPTANLDPAGAIEVAELIAKLRDAGRTLILVEHQINRLAAMADRVVVLDAGRIRYDGSPREVLREHGRSIRDELGLWIPQVSEFALEVNPTAGTFAQFPLRVEDLPAGIEAGPLTNVTDAAGTARSEVDGNEYLVRAERVAYRYETGTPALSDVSCSIRAGESVALLGQNGSGKTTFASLLVGLRQPDAGNLVVCGNDATKVGVEVLARDVSYVFQYPEHQFVAETVADDAAYALERRGVSRIETQTRVDAMLSRFGLEDLRDRHPFKLSMGQKRRLSVADMLVTDPRLLILDEPTAGQDRRNTHALIDLLDELRRRIGLAILVITHDLTLVADWCDRALVLDEGKTVFEGTTRDLFVKLDDGALPTRALQSPDQWAIARRLWSCNGDCPLLDAHALGEAVRRLPS
jgi:energy-coupling factor transport system ATP-binding protein